MFTGIVEERGRVATIESAGSAARLAVACETVIEGAAVGDSISVSGCCLTVTELSDEGFVSDLMGETLSRTALGDLRVGGPVNLERAMPLDGRLGGHLVQGHVDAVVPVRAVFPEGEWTTMVFGLPADLAAYVAEKGSVALDGVSLTVAGLDDDTFAVGLIPHTLSVTTLGTLAPGDRVNLEVDLLAKYVARLLGRAGALPAEEER